MHRLKYIWVISILLMLSACYNNTLPQTPTQSSVASESSSQAFLPDPTISAHTPAHDSYPDIYPTLDIELPPEIIQREGYYLTGFGERDCATYSFSVYVFLHDQGDIFDRYWEIMVKEDDEVIDILQVEEDEYGSGGEPYDMMVFEMDVNFDGINDVLISLGDFGPSPHFKCYLTIDNQLVHCPGFEAIPNPCIDTEGKHIYSFYRISAGSHGTDKYIVKSNEYIKTESIIKEHDSESDVEIYRYYVRENGEMVLRDSFTNSEAERKANIDSEYLAGRENALPLWRFTKGKETLDDYVVIANNGGKEQVMHTVKYNDYQPGEEYPELQEFFIDNVTEAGEQDGFADSLSVDVAEYDISSDGLMDYIIKLNSSWYGKFSPMQKLLIRQPDKSFKEIFLGWTPSNISFMRSKTNDLPDISYSCYGYIPLYLYDGELGYISESPKPMYLNEMGSGVSLQYIKDGKLCCEHFIGALGDALEYEMLPYHIGFKYEEFAPYLKNPIIWARDDNENIASFFGEFYDGFALFIGEIDDEEGLTALLEERQSGYDVFFPDETLFVYVPHKYYIADDKREEIVNCLKQGVPEIDDYERYRIALREDTSDASQDLFFYVYPPNPAAIDEPQCSNYTICVGSHDRSEIWNVFYIDANLKDILWRNPDESKTLTLDEWRESYRYPKYLYKGID